MEAGKSMSKGSLGSIALAAALLVSSGCATSTGPAAPAYMAGKPIMTAEQFAAMVRVEVRPSENDLPDDLLLARRR